MTVLNKALILEMLDEKPWHATKIGKIYMGALASVVVEQPVSCKVRGTAKEIRVIRAALDASRKFRKGLTESGATVDSVITLLDSKRTATKSFEKVFGAPWPM